LGSLRAEKFFHRLSSQKSRKNKINPKGISTRYQTRALNRFVPSLSKRLSPTTQTPPPLWVNISHVSVRVGASIGHGVPHQSLVMKALSVVAFAVVAVVAVAVVAVAVAVVAAVVV